MPLSSEQRHPIMCITQDSPLFTHVEQAEAMCVAGARWIQLRMKQVAKKEWMHTAGLIAAICREHGAIFIVNDSVELAMEVDADGVHLGKEDMDWAEARRRLGMNRIIGGTVNNANDARKALAAHALDYVGVGPLRFTTTKQKLAPVLGLPGVQDLISVLHPLPAWVIGGVEAADLAAIRATGAAGVAVSSALVHDGKIEANYEILRDAWMSDQPQRPFDALRPGHGGTK